MTFERDSHLYRIHLIILRKNRTDIIYFKIKRSSDRTPVTKILCFLYQDSKCVYSGYNKSGFLGFRE